MICPKCTKEIDKLCHYIEAVVDIETHETKFAGIWNTTCPECNLSIDRTYSIFYGNPAYSKTMAPGDVDFSEVNSKLFGRLLKNDD